MLSASPVTSSRATGSRPSERENLAYNAIVVKHPGKSRGARSQRDVGVGDIVELRRRPPNSPGPLPLSGLLGLPPIFAGTGRAGLNVVVVGVVSLVVSVAGAEIDYLIGRFAG